MKPFTLMYSVEATQRIRHLHPTIKGMIRLAIDDLRENPWLGKSLQRELLGVWSLRIKSYRILYTIEERNRRVTIQTFGLRRTIYGQATIK